MPVQSFASYITSFCDNLKKDEIKKQNYKDQRGKMKTWEKGLAGEKNTETAWGCKREVLAR